MKIAELGFIYLFFTMSEYPDVLLFGWWQGLKANDRNAVSYGGWIAVERLAPHLGTNYWFQKMGEACGGLVEVDRRTANFGLSV